MSQVNQKRKVQPAGRTHEGGAAVRTTAYAQLRRTILNCLLWEDTFYESGVSIADRIKALVPQVQADTVFNLAIEARNEFGLRHAPLLLAREMARGTPEQRKLVDAVLPAIMNRPDEIAEFISLYWATNDGKKFISHPIRRGIANAINRFDAWKLAKWDRKDRDVRIRDALFMAHVRPFDLPANAPKWSKAERKADRANGEKRAWQFTERETVHFQVAQDLLTQTGTWEDRMSAGEKAYDVFSDLMAKQELGGLAFIRNVRKMEQAGIPADAIRAYSQVANLRGIFPHQLLTAARHNVQYESMFDAMMLRALAGIPKLAGYTVVLVDVSGSMDQDMVQDKAVATRRAHAAKAGKPMVENTKRIDAACAVAIMARELCERVRIFTFSNKVVEIPDRRGMALRDEINRSQIHSSTYLAAAVNAIVERVQHDRMIVITDEQSHDGSGTPASNAYNYMINVAPYQKSVATKGLWESISGWSPQVIRFITQLEAETVEATAETA